MTTGTPIKRDLRLDNHTSLTLLRPLSEAGKAWMKRICPPGDDRSYYHGALVLEPHDALELTTRAIDEGLTFE